MFRVRGGGGRGGWGGRGREERVEESLMGGDLISNPNTHER